MQKIRTSASFPKGTFRCQASFVYLSPGITNSTLWWLIAVGNLVSISIAIDRKQLSSNVTWTIYHRRDCKIATFFVSFHLTNHIHRTIPVFIKANSRAHSGLRQMNSTEVFTGHRSTRNLSASLSYQIPRSKGYAYCRQC